MASAVSDRDHAAFRRSLRAALIGSAAWVAWILWREPDPITMLLGLAALVLHPLTLRLPLLRGGTATQLWRWTAIAQLPAAIAVAVALVLPRGSMAAALACPWLAVTGLTAFVGLQRAWARGRTQPLEELSIDLGHVLVPIGGMWIVVTCLGATPLGLSPTIVLLTAVHFHYAGFVMPVLAGMAGRRIDHGAYRAVPVGILLGVPLTAVGITASPLVEMTAAVLLALSGSGLAIAQLALARQSRRRVTSLLLALSALSLALAMTLAAVYGIGEFRGDPWPPIPDMAHLHGTANALGFCLLGVWAWTLEPSAPRRATPRSTPGDPHE